MIEERKTWSKSEVIDLITGAIGKTRKDCQNRGVPVGARLTAQAIYAYLNANDLIELKP